MNHPTQHRILRRHNQVNRRTRTLKQRRHNLNTKLSRKLRQRHNTVNRHRHTHTQSIRIKRLNNSRILTVRTYNLRTRSHRVPSHQTIQHLRLRHHNTIRRRTLKIRASTPNTRRTERIKNATHRNNHQQILQIINQFIRLNIQVSRSRRPTTTRSRLIRNMFHILTRLLQISRSRNPSILKSLPRHNQQRLPSLRRLLRQLRRHPHKPRTTTLQIRTQASQRSKRRHRSQLNHNIRQISRLNRIMLRRNFLIQLRRQSSRLPINQIQAHRTRRSQFTNNTSQRNLRPRHNHTILLLQRQRQISSNRPRLTIQLHSRLLRRFTRTHHMNTSSQVITHTPLKRRRMRISQLISLNRRNPHTQTRNMRPILNRISTYPTRRNIQRRSNHSRRRHRRHRHTTNRRSSLSQHHRIDQPSSDQSPQHEHETEDQSSTQDEQNHKNQSHPSQSR